MEHFEPGVITGIAGNGDRAPLLGHPAGDPLPQSQPDMSDEFGMGIFRGPENEFIPSRVQQVNEAGIRFGDFNGNVHDIMQDRIEIQIAADRLADSMQDLGFPSLVTERPPKSSERFLPVLLHDAPVLPRMAGTIARGMDQVLGRRVARNRRISASSTGLTIT